MTSFSDYLNNIEAEETLKNNTETYVRTELSDRAGREAFSARKIKGERRSFPMKKMIVTLSAVAACAILAVGGYAYYNTPVNYVSLDINPSVEFGINAFDRVVSAESYNEDGALLLSENKYTHQKLADAIDILVQEAAEQGFVQNDGTTVIAVTAESNNEKTAAELTSSCEAGIHLALGKANASAIIYTDSVNLQLRTQAMEAGVSPGKFRLIEMLQTLDPEVTVEQYRNARITDILAEANEMMSGNSGGQNGAYAGVLDRIRDAAEQVQAADGTLEQEQEQIQNQGTETEIQQQAQNQNSEDSGQGQTQTPNPSATPSAGTEGNGQNGTDNGQSSAGANSDNAGPSSDNGANPAGND